MSRIVYHPVGGDKWDIPYAPVPMETRNAIRLYKPTAEEELNRPRQEDRNKCMGQDPMKWPGNWKQTLDESMYMMTETMGNYSIHNTVMSEVSRLNHDLSKAEECELLLQAANDDLAARNKVIESHLSLAYKIAKTQQKKFKRLEFTEMLAVAFATVVEQVDGIIAKIKDGEENHKRIYTIIHQPIVFAIKRRGSKHQQIEVPRQKLYDAHKLNATLKDLALELLRVPDEDEILKSLGWGELRYNNTIEAKDALTRPVRYDGIDGGIDTLEIYDPHLQRTRSYNLEEVVDYALTEVLKPKEADVIALYFGLGEEQLPLNRISEAVGIAGPNVSKTKTRALDKLKEFFLEINIKKF